MKKKNVFIADDNSVHETEDLCIERDNDLKILQILLDTFGVGHGEASFDISNLVDAKRKLQIYLK